MPNLSDAPGSPPTGVLVDHHVPFTAFLRANPVRGKRLETYESLKRESNIIEIMLESACDGVTYPITFDFAKPVAFTPQFGNSPSRFTIHGHACVRNDFANNPIGNRYVDADNKIMQGPAASNNSNRTPDPQVNSIAEELRALLETRTGLHVFKLRVAGIVYGDKGVHFPLG